MGEMTSHLYRVCLSNIKDQMEFKSMSDPDKVYVAVYGDHYGARYHDWECNCPGFKFRKTCKHVEIAESKRCAWNEGAYMGSPEPEPDDNRCPDCGGETHVIDFRA